jgi:hypothetical protein
VPDAVRIAAIWHRFRKPPAYPKLALRFPKQQQASIGRLVAAPKSAVSFLRRTDGRSKGSGVASLMSAVALGWYAMQLVSTPNCYVNRAFGATAVTSSSALAHNPG